MTELEGYWGKHLTLDCKGCGSFITNKEVVSGFVRYLVARIGMKAYGPLWIESFGEGEDKAGFTFFQPIMTSNIVGHCVDATGELYLDVFSCKDFDEALVEGIVRQMFEPEKITSRTVYRKA
jgi:hypothetical protein